MEINKNRLNMNKLTCLFLLIFLVSCNSEKGPVRADMGSAYPDQEVSQPSGKELSEPSEATLSIARLYSEKEKYNDRVITVKGKVVKVNPAIMGLNWVHIQDGTGDEGSNDLTVTSTQEFKVGTEVAVKGRISLDKDFGYGYFYEVLMENGEHVK
jgi:hypothetical protein